jgi:hypothetical protein
MSFEAGSNSELTVIVPAYQLHFRFPVQNKIHKQIILSDTGTGILGSIADPCDFLPARGLGIYIRILSLASAREKIIE